MEYRRLGEHGLKVSELSLGAWLTFGEQIDEDTARECMLAAHEAGANYFDNADVYAHGIAFAFVRSLCYDSPIQSNRSTPFQASLLSYGD